MDASRALIALSAFFSIIAGAASSTTFYDARATLSLALKRVDGGATASLGPTVIDFAAVAVGDFGTIANADPLATSFTDGPLAVGGVFTFAGAAFGGTTSSLLTKPNAAASFYDFRSTLRVTGAAGASGRALFEGFYSLSSSVRRDNPATETAFVSFALSGGGTNVRIDRNGGSSINVSNNRFGFFVDVAPGEVRMVEVNLRVSGETTAEPITVAPIPLPAAAPLLLAGLGALAVATRRRHARR